MINSLERYYVYYRFYCIGPTSFSFLFLFLFFFLRFRSYKLMSLIKKNWFKHSFIYYVIKRHIIFLPHKFVYFFGNKILVTIFQSFNGVMIWIYFLGKILKLLQILLQKVPVIKYVTFLISLNLLSS